MAIIIIVFAGVVGIVVRIVIIDDYLDAYYFQAVLHQL